MIIILECFFANAIEIIDFPLAEYEYSNKQKIMAQSAQFFFKRGDPQKEFVMIRFY